MDLLKPDRDKKITHAVETVNVSLRAGDEARAIEEAMARLNARSLAAAMVIMSTTVTQTVYDRNGECYLLYTVMVQWMSRENLEALQRQQRILGGGQNGGR